jgi:UPF0716 protein FxsA
MPYLFLLFVLMPIVEIAVLIQIGGAIGGWTTVGIVILTAFIGTYMLRQQGIATLAQAQQRMNSGQMPAQQMLEGLFLLIGGLLLLTPGFITDFFGFLCLIPPSRRFLANKLASHGLSGFNVVVGGMGSSHTRSSSTTAGPKSTINSNNYQNTDEPGGRSKPAGNASGTAGSSKPKSGGDVIEGDYRHLD